MTEPNYDDITVLLDLPRLGELIAHVAHTLCELREIELPDLESQEMRTLAISGWRHVCFMADRAEFAQSVEADLAALDEPVPQVDVTSRGVTHRPEFGFFEPPV